MPLADIERTRKPNGQFSSEYARRIRSRRGGLNSALARKSTGYRVLIEAGILASKRRSLLTSLLRCMKSGFECDHTRALIAALTAPKHKPTK